MSNAALGFGNARQGIGNANFRSNSNICFTCRRACGGCEWTEWDMETGKIRFEPVPGWTAEKAKLNLCHGSRKTIIDTYHIIDCPKYLSDRRS